MGSNNVLHTRRCFYVNAYYEGSHANKAYPMYVEELKPANPTQKYPVIFWHGFSSTGACWVTTPDGRPGWASFFMRNGYTVYVVDGPERGRSAADHENMGNFTNVDAQYVESFFTDTSHNNAVWSQAKLLTQWPGSGTRGDPVFEHFMAGEVQSRADNLTAELQGQAAGKALLEEIGPAIVCGHSAGGFPVLLVADAVPALVQMLILLEPGGPPFIKRVISGISSSITPSGAAPSEKIAFPYGLTTAPLTYSPAVNDPADLKIVTKPTTNPDLSDIILQADPPRLLPNLSKVPMLIVTSEAGYHANYDHATVAYLQQAGVAATHLRLEEAGIRGNGHFMFLEKNSDEVAECVLRATEKILNKV